MEEAPNRLDIAFWPARALIELIEGLLATADRTANTCRPAGSWRQ
jgi:hypothetical protein